MYILLFFVHIPFVVNHTFNAMPPERLRQHPLLLTTNRTVWTFFLWRLHLARPSTSWSQHHFVAIGKSRTACAQSLALWQQATIEIMRRNYSSRMLVILFNRSQHGIGRDSVPQSLYYCLFTPRISIVILRAHPVRGESHIQSNATREVATVLGY